MSDHDQVALQFRREAADLLHRLADRQTAGDAEALLLELPQDRSSITLIKGVGGIQAEREILAVLSECQLIACYVHGTVGHLIENRSGSVEPGARPTGSAPTLTERERECLSWAATGKTAAEVATALSLSKTTIIYHLTRARRKLDAANSRQAITKALSLKLIASA